MAGMLPGVELARRRRTNHHFFDSNSRESFRHQRLETSTTMDKTALKARQRLEEKLRGFAPASTRGSSKPQTNITPNNNNESRSSKPAKEAEKGGKDDAVKAVLVGRQFTQLERRNSQTEVCSICLEEFGTQQQVMNLPCFHRYHSDCLLPWLNTRSHCPYCRTHVHS